MFNVISNITLFEAVSAAGMMVGVSMILWGLRSVSIGYRHSEEWRTRVLSDDLTEEGARQNTQAREKTLTSTTASSVDSLATKILSNYRERNIRQVRYGVRTTAILIWICALALCGQHSFGVLVGVLIGVASIAVLVEQHLVRGVSAAITREIDFFLPVVMERIVMAVEAGIDIFPAVKRVVEIGSKDSRNPDDQRASRIDPVTKLLELVVNMVESGRRFEEALSEVASGVNSSALKHAFIHLSVAAQEGGEVVHPLRELSDATQLYFQEQVEEEIATLPVRATLPLLGTFAGLILFFITAPLMQVLGMMSEVVPK